MVWNGVVDALYSRSYSNEEVGMEIFQLSSMMRNKRAMVAALFLSLVSCGGGGDGGSGAPAVVNVLGITWSAPLFREDGSPLNLADVAQYRIYYGTAPGDYQNHLDIDGNSTLQGQVSGLASGKYYAVVTTVDSDGRESLYSSEVEVDL